jgi:hypothetical protein
MVRLASNITTKQSLSDKDIDIGFGMLANLQQDLMLALDEEQEEYEQPG